MIYKFPCFHTDKGGLARSKRAARIFMRAFYPTEIIIGIKYNIRSISMDVYTLGEDNRVLWVAPKEVLGGNY